MPTPTRSATCTCSPTSSSRRSANWWRPPADIRRRVGRSARDTVAVPPTRGACPVRVYLPATTTVLQRLVDEGSLSGPHTAFAVTEALRRYYAVSDAEADVEELEYAALRAAA